MQGNLSLALETTTLLQTHVSSNFKVYETLVTEHASLEQAQLLYFATNPRLWFNAARLAIDVLEPIRAHPLAGEGFSPSSWGRCPDLNKILPGSSDTSLHCDWLAADILAGERKKLEAVWKYLQYHQPAGEVIVYLDEHGRAWRIHVAAYDPVRAKGERLAKRADGKLLSTVPRDAFVA